MTSAAPSPPAENVSTIQHQPKQALQGENGTSKNVTIECDFTHIDEENYRHEDILILERFKEAIELLIIKVGAHPNALEPPLSLQDCRLSVPQELHRSLLLAKPHTC